MYTETEAKLKVDSLDEIESKLSELGAEFLEEQLQKDYYFDDADSALAKTDRCLRLRRLLVGKSEKFFLTYKGAREKSEFKRRQEIEIQVGDGDSAERLMLALGYRKTMTLEKKRRIWKLDECEIDLDELPLLGSFVEIEGPDSKKIAEVQRNLGLSKLSHIPETYTALIENKLRQPKK